MTNSSSQETSDDVSIREAQPTDAAAIIHFLRQASQESDAILITGLQSLTSAKESDNLATIQRSDDCEVVVAYLGQQVIGIVTIMVVADHPDTGELGVVVARNYWHNGIGSALLDTILDWYQHGSSLHQLVLDVFADNERAINLYRHYGFDEVSRGQTKTSQGVEKPLLHMIYD